MVLPTANPSKSYWIEAAQSPLANLNSTPELPKETDIVIVGSGYTGSTLAYWIHKVSTSCRSIDYSKYTYRCDSILPRMVLYLKCWFSKRETFAEVRQAGMVSLLCRENLHIERPRKTTGQY